MKNKDMLVNAIINGLFITLSCFFARVFSQMAVKLVDLFVALDFIAAAGIRAVTLTLFAAFFIVFISFKYGYHMAVFDKKDATLGASLGAAAHFLIGAVTLFPHWLSGGTKHISGFIAFGNRYTSNEYIKDIPFVTLALVGVVTAALFAGLVVLGTYLGVKKRLCDRAELTGKSDGQAK